MSFYNEKYKNSILILKTDNKFALSGHQNIRIYPFPILWLNLKFGFD